MGIARVFAMAANAQVATPIVKTVAIDVIYFHANWWVHKKVMQLARFNAIASGIVTTARKTGAPVLLPYQSCVCYVYDGDFALRKWHICLSWMFSLCVEFPLLYHLLPCVYLNILLP